MTPVAAPTKKVSLLGNPGGELVLLIRGTGRAGQEVRLQGARCSVGSAPGSTLRLVAAGVEPLHCMLLRGARGTIVRRFAADTRLNGVPFENAPLTVGDVLKIGPLEFEVAATAAADEVELHAPSNLRIERDELQRRCEVLEAQREQWEHEARSFERQCNDLRAELASERAVRELGRNALEQEQEARAELDRERQAWEERREEAERNLAERLARSEQLAGQQAEWDVRLKDLDATQAGLEKQRSELTAATREVVDQRRILDRQAGELDANRAKLESDRERLQESWQELRAQRRALEAERQAGSDGARNAAQDEPKGT